MNKIKKDNKNKKEIPEIQDLESGSEFNDTIHINIDKIDLKKLTKNIKINSSK